MRFAFLGLACAACLSFGVGSASAQHIHVHGGSSHGVVVGGYGGHYHGGHVHSSPLIIGGGYAPGYYGSPIYNAPIYSPGYPSYYGGFFDGPRDYRGFAFLGVLWWRLWPSSPSPSPVMRS